MNFSCYKIDKAISLRNEQYYTFLGGAINRAQKRIWAAIFIVNPTVDDDQYLLIRNLLKRLQYAIWRNVDARVLVGVSESLDISIANETAYHYLSGLGVPVHKYVGKQGRSMHSKYVLLDDDLLVCGSHNWTHGAIDLFEEDSIAVYSKEMNIILGNEFSQNWQNSEPVPKEQ